MQQLTTRETEILQRIALGNSTKQIAEELNLSIHTINAYRKQLKRKLNVTGDTNRAFTMYAIEHSLILPSKPGVVTIN